MKEACLTSPGSVGMFERTMKLKMIPGFLRTNHRDFSGGEEVFVILPRLPRLCPPLEIIVHWNSLLTCGPPFAPTLVSSSLLCTPTGCSRTEGILSSVYPVSQNITFLASSPSW